MIIPTPVIDRANRARCTLRSPDRHAAGRQRAIIGTKKTRPSTATGMPAMCDWALVVTVSQLKVVVLGQASARWVSKWVMVRYTDPPSRATQRRRGGMGCHRSGGMLKLLRYRDQLSFRALAAAWTP